MADEAGFFPKPGMDFGVYYYPEHWPENQWERDIKNMAGLGFDFVHLAEFAWARMEPEDGKFDFAWLDRVVDQRFVCTYRYRQPLFGVEQFHHGIMQTDGVTPGPGGQEFATSIKEIRKVSEHLKPEVTNRFARASRTGFLWSNRNVMNVESYRHHQDWDTWQHLYTYYQSLKRMAVDVEFVTETDPFDPSELPFLVVPAYQMMSKQLVGMLEAYAQAGGHLILSTRTALKDERGHLWEAKIQQPIWNLIGGQIEYYDHLPREGPGMIRLGGKSYPWHIWGTVCKPFTGTEVWGAYGRRSITRTRWWSYPFPNPPRCSSATGSCYPPACWSGGNRPENPLLKLRSLG